MAKIQFRCQRDRCASLRSYLGNGWYVMILNGFNWLPTGVTEFERETTVYAGAAWLLQKGCLSICFKANMPAQRLL